MPIKDFINENKENMIRDIIRLINIPTVYDEGTSLCSEGAPFGKSVKMGLETILSIAEQMGMKVENYNGYAGEITIGNGDYIIGILGHIDVVEAGEGWETSPFDGKVIDGKIYGRGSSDDKGPVVSCLYVMKYFLDNNMIPEDISLRMIVGTNEEEEWQGIEYYVDHAQRLPNVSIVPDGYFPLIFCEKGLIDFDMIKKVTVDNSRNARIIELKGGTGRNIVPSKAFCKIQSQKTILKEMAKTLEHMESIETIINEDVLSIVATGRSTHAMSPEKGVNAISLLMVALNKIKADLTHSDLIEVYNQFIGMDYNGEKFGCGFEDQVSGKLTFNIGTINLDKESVKIAANLRYPASEEFQVVRKAMDKTFEKAGFEYVEKAKLPSICVEKDSFFVKKLMEAYQKVTGDLENEPFAIGGATYARAIPNAVAFGPLFPYEEELAHEANEFISVDSLIKMSEIFACGLELLMKRDGEYNAR